MNFEEIYAAYYPKVFRLSMGYLNDHDTAQDITQETFIKIWQQLPKFRKESSIGTWIFKIASNNCLRQIENNNRRSKTKAGFRMTQNTATTTSIDEPMEFLYNCISKLPELERIIISLELENVQQKDIATIVGISEGNVRVKIHRIKQKLKEQFQQYEQ